MGNEEETVDFGAHAVMSREREKPRMDTNGHEGESVGNRVGIGAELAAEALVTGLGRVHKRSMCLKMVKRSRGTTRVCWRFCGRKRNPDGSLEPRISIHHAPIPSTGCTFIGAETLARRNARLLLSAELAGESHHRRIREEMLSLRFVC